MNNVIKSTIIHSLKSLLKTNVRCLSSNSLIKNAKKFNHHLNSDHICEFQRIIGKNGVKTDDLDGFNTDWLKIHKGIN